MMRSSDKILLSRLLNSPVVYVLLLGFAIFTGFLMAKDMQLGLGLIAGVVGLIILFICLMDTEAGLYITMTHCFFISHFNRLLFNDLLPVGVVVDILIFATYLGLLLRRKDLHEVLQEFAKHPAVICLLLVYSYMAIELFNPYSHFFVGWFAAFRKVVETLLLLFTAFALFDTKQKIKRYITVLFILCFVSGLYGCIQQWHGFFPFEMDWLRADPKRFRMTFVGGDSRKMSTMPDALSFSIVMAVCSVLFIALLNAQKKFWSVVLMSLTIVFMLLGMTYSITRTANAMVVGGLVMYMLLTIKRRLTRIFSVFFLLAFLVLMYAPVNNQQVSQFRSTFEGKKDPSYRVREDNRKSIQPYMYRHPIGAGLNTTGDDGLQYNPGHFLAGFPPDSGYLKKALEMGWIGFGMLCILYFLVLKTGIRGYFSCRDEEIKLVYAGCTAACFAFYVGDFAQVAMGQFTDVVVYYPFIAILLRLKNFDQPDKLPTHEIHFAKPEKSA